jgi:glycosyltransferase involved in cell wall biosynthesis
MHYPSLITAIIPVYNGERYLAEAIESVSAQTYRPIEVIVVDDGSTDGTARVAQRFGSIRYCRQLHGGIGSARNRGVALAKGGVLAFLDADDLWEKDKLRLQMAALDDAEIDVVFGHVRQFISPELDEYVKKSLYCPDKLMPGYAPSAVMIRRDAFNRVGPFETIMRVGEFASWYLRAAEMGLRMLMLQDLVARRRLHKTNTGIHQRQARTDYVRILKASLDRRRADAHANSRLNPVKSE